MKSVGLSDLSDSEEDDPIPCIASFMVQRSNHAHIDEASNIATKADTIEPQMISPLSEVEEGRDPQFGNTKWQVLIKSQTWLVKQRQVRSDYIAYSEVGPDFKLLEVSKNVHELDPFAIPNMSFHPTFNVHLTIIQCYLQQHWGPVYKEGDRTFSWKIYSQL